MLISTKEASEIMRCDRHTLAKHAEQLGGQKFGKVWRFNKERVESFAGGNGNEVNEKGKKVFA